MSAVQSVVNYLRRVKWNYKGSRVKGRYLVLESDDWGMIRMAGPDVYQALLRKGYPVDQNCYSRYDALECNADLQGLIEILDSVRDINGRPAAMTINNVVGNPDFSKIQASDFQQYHYELFTETLRSYPCHDQVMKLYQDGICAGLLYPQFHGREHVHVNNWLRALQGEDTYTRAVFPYGMFSINKQGNNSAAKVYLDAMACYSQDDLNFVTASVEDGLKRFEQIWGFRSATLIAPCYTWNTALHDVFRNNGIQMLQSSCVRFEPKGMPDAGHSIHKVTMGQAAMGGLRYLMRNAMFEPSTNPKIDWVDACLADIKQAFFWQKPAIVSTHRLNFTGWLDPANRSRNLAALRKLLRLVVKHYPDVQFTSSAGLVSLFTSGHERP